MNKPKTISDFFPSCEFLKDFNGAGMTVYVPLEGIYHGVKNQSAPKYMTYCPECALDGNKQQEDNAVGVSLEEQNKA